MTEDEKREYDEMMEDLKALGIEPVKTKNEKDEEDELLLNGFTFGDREPTILLAFEAIINRSEDCGLHDDSIYVETAEVFDYVTKKLDLTPKQVLVLALTVNFCSDQRIEMNDYCRHLSCTSFRFLPYLKELENRLNIGDFNDTEPYREYLYCVPPSSEEDGWWLAEGNEYKFYLGDLPARII